MTEVADKTTSLWKDSYLAYIPLLGAAVAVTFDVGYFFALNWSFFTLFSLSEHILFAIQAFPIALVVILLGLIGAGIILNAPSWPSPAAPVNPQTLHGIKLVGAYVILALLVLAPFSLFSYLLYSTPILTPLLIETFIFLGGLVFIPDPYKRVFIAATAVVFVLTFSFFVGYLFSASAIISADPNNFFQLEVGTINLKNGATINGRIIRSGERGVLIYDQVSDRLRFLLWQGISSIEALPRPSPPRRAGT
jgi:hypothetical protein